MKVISKISSVLVAACMVLSFAACGNSSQPAQTTAAPETEAQTEAATEAVTEAATEAETEAGIPAGTYTFNYVDVYGDETKFTVTTKETGKVFVMYEGALGSKTLNADNWTDNGDGTFTTDKLNGDLDLEFVAADGTITWILDGENVTPSGYTEPTEFIEKENKAPMSAAEAVGVYSFGFVNAYGATVPYIINIKADKTADITMVSAWVGNQTYHAGNWEYVADSKVAFSEMTWDGEEPRTDGNGAVWFAEGTYESTWVLDGDGGCEPEGYDGDKGEIDFTTLDAAVYPADSSVVGIYTFGFVNAYGATVPYVVYVKADKTADIVMVSAWVGSQFYHAGSWTVNDADGSISFADMTWDGEEPRTDGNGAVWFAEGTYESTWILNADHTCEPKDYDGDKGEIDLSTLDPAIYPQ